MQINRRITNGLAWAGVALVVGVPAADFISGKLLDPRVEASTAVASVEAPDPAPLSQRPTATQPAQVATKPVAAKPVAVAAATPVAVAAKPATPRSGDAVDTYLQSGKALPSYLTEAPTAAAPATAATPIQPQQPALVAPAPTAVAVATPTAPSGIDPVTVASLPREAAPVPMPLSMRPRAVVATRAPAIDAVPPALVIDEAPRNNAPIDEADLDDWESGPLADFLAQREGRGSRATFERNSDGYDAPPARRFQGDRVVAPVADDFFYPFIP